MKHLLTKQEQRDIATAIAEVEQHTAGELVVVVAARSAPYDDWRAGLTAFLTLGTALALYLFVPAIPGAWVLAGEAPLAVLCWWLVGRPAILRRIVPREVRQSAVDARARQLFIEQGLTETRDRSGVLIFVSELEHRVDILADKGIHERVGVEGWRQDVETIVQAIRGGRAAAGLHDAIRRIGSELAADFPARPDDENELSNQVVRVT